MIVLDACILIAHFDSQDVLHDRAGELLASIADEQLLASPITTAEVLVAPARTGRLDLAMAAVAQLNVVTVPLNEDAPARLALLRAETSLKLPDCCVLLAAEQEGKAAIATFDERLDAIARRRGIAVLNPLRPR
ncbi:MAG TPA: type II toxin-antitoxin system VapC family toxin [Streptosporangiaceae bacterium]